MALVRLTSLTYTYSYCDEWRESSFALDLVVIRTSGTASSSYRYINCDRSCRVIIAVIIDHSTHYYERCQCWCTYGVQSAINHIVRHERWRCDWCISTRLLLFLTSPPHHRSLELICKKSERLYTCVFPILLYVLPRVDKLYDYPRHTWIFLKERWNRISDKKRLSIREQLISLVTKLYCIAFDLQYIVTVQKHLHIYFTSVVNGIALCSDYSSPHG